MNVIGVIEYQDQQYLDRYGYNYDIEELPILAYSSGDTIYFRKENDNYRVVPDYVIKNFYTIEAAKMEYPELFL